MTCSNCGFENEATSRFCASCGHPTRVHADERRVVTVVFADIVGFTTLSENLDPERVKRLVDVAFERLVGDVHEFGGRVDKIVGDAIVALFGAPVAHEDDAERAVRAALRMQETLAEYATESSIGIRMRIGVNTGEVLVGALRAGGDYTAMGDVVNTASRLETSANPGEVLVGSATYAATREVIGYESRGSLIVRGREAAVDVWVATEALVPPGYRPRRVTPLVGRDTELAVLRNLAELSIQHGRGQMVVLLGEAGVGKTRLANEIAPLVLGIDPTTSVLNGRCVPYGEANPWWPIAEALRESCSIESDDDAGIAQDKCRQAVEFVLTDRSAVEDVVTGLMHLMGYDGPLRALDAARARGEASSALFAFVEAGVKVRPVVIRLADLHWADEQVLELIDDMMERLARQPFVLVATARRSLLERWSPKAGRQNSIVMNLDPLDRDAAGELLDALLAADVPDHVRSMLLDRSGGNPFYLEELATLLAERDGDAAEATDVPDTLRGLIAARLDGLTPDEQLTLEDASVWGASGPMIALAEMGRAVHGNAEVEPLVASLATKDIFVVGGEDDWAFRSDIVREIAYSRLTKTERLRRHLGIASYLEAAFGGEFRDDGFVDTVSRHFAEAARLSHELGRTTDGASLDERAIRWLGEAARRADQSASWPLAARLYDQALELATAKDAREQRLGFLLARAHVRNEMWNFVGAREDATEAASLIDEVGDDAAAARVELVFGEVESREGSYGGAVRHYDAAVAKFDALGDVQNRGEALRLKGMAALYRNDAASAEEPIALSLEAFRTVGDRRGEAWALQNLAWIAFVTGRTVDAEQRLEESFEAFTEIDDRTGLAWTEGLLAFVRMYQGRFAEAEELATRILQESERRNDRWAQAMMLIVLGAINLWEGRTETAVDLANRASANFRSLGDPIGLQQALSLSGRAHLMAGLVSEGLELITEATGSLDISEVGPENVVAATTQLAARVQLGLEQPIDPAALMSAIGSLALGELPTDLAAAAGLALAQAGDPEQACKVLWLGAESADAAAGAKVIGGYGASSRALVHAALGDHDAAGAITIVGGDGSTYLDRATLHVAVGLGRGPGWLEAFAAAMAEVEGTCDRLTRATVELARATAAEAVGHDLAVEWRDQAEASWTELGVDPRGWRRLFTAAAATAPASR